MKSHLMTQMISLRLDLKPLLETDAEFDLVRWAEEGLDNISAAKLSKITALFLKKAPKTFRIQKKVNDSEAAKFVNVLKKVRELWDAKIAEAKAAAPKIAGSGVALPAAAAPDKPTTAATGVALPAAATPGEPQLTTEDRATLTHRFNTDNLFRAEVIGAQQLLSRSLGSIMKIDEFATSLDVCLSESCFTMP